MAIPPAGAFLDPFRGVGSLSFDPGSGTVHVVIIDPGIRRHRTGRIHVVAFVPDPVPARAGHSTIGRKVIPVVQHVVPAGDHGTIGRKVIPVIFVGKPSGLHFSIAVQIIVRGTQTKPSGHHISVGTEIVPGIIDQRPGTGQVRTIRVGIPVALTVVMPAVIDFGGIFCTTGAVIGSVYPGGYCHGTVGIEKVFRSIDDSCTGSHGAGIRIQIVIGAGTVQPSGLHRAGGRIQEIIVILMKQPSGFYDSIASQVIP